MTIANRQLPVETPDPVERMLFDDPAEAVERLVALYDRASGFLLDRFLKTLEGQPPRARYRAFYPEVRMVVPSHTKTDSRLSFGHVAVPGVYATSITRPDLFRGYLTEQIGLLMKNHGICLLYTSDAADE